MRCQHAVLLAVLFLAVALPVRIFAEEDVVEVDLSKIPQVNPGIDVGSTGTDAGAAEREAQSMHKQYSFRASSEKYAFQAEVNRLMDIIINSLYSNKDVFLRELISNASDALDKIRFTALTDKSALGEGDDSKLEIKVSLDKDNNVLYLKDTGIGMTKEDLIKNLGTIAKSGTAAFLEKLQKGGDINLIGQFGLGFYSVYLVADYVEVITKHNDDKQYIWESNADGNFAISEDTENEPLGRGTLIKIHLKGDAKEYADEAKIKELIGKYSEFINFPIYLLSEKEVEVPVEEEEDTTTEDKTEEASEDKKEDEAEKEDEKAEGDDVEDDEEEEDETAKDEEKPKKTRKEKRKEWDLLNDSKAIWLRKPSQVTEEEYKKFYKAVSKDYGDALSWTHFKAEGDVEFRTVLFIPETAPFDFYDRYYERGAKLKLYVRRVFISDDVEDLLPKYLSFLAGLVDSDTLPLNVSREMLQQHTSLKTIKKKLIRKALDLIKKLADTEKECKEADEKEGGEEEEESKKPDAKECGKYKKFWDQFGKAMKLGIIEDTTNRNRLSKLLRFHTSKHKDTLTSLEDYIGRMKEGQQNIYYLTGADQAEIEKSPFLEQLVKKGYEVIYFTDVLDEYVMQHLLEFDDKKFQNISKEDLKLADADEKERARDKQLKEDFKDLTKWWKKQLGEDKVQNVKVSNRLATTPCVVVTSKYASSATMQRIQRAQAMSGNKAMFMGGKGQRTLEINPRHPLVKTLRDVVAADEADAKATDLAQLLYETALLESGFEVDDVKEFNRRVYKLVKENLDLDVSLESIEEDPEVEEEPVEAAEEPVEAAEEPVEAVAEDLKVEEVEEVKDEL